MVLHLVVFYVSCIFAYGKGMVVRRYVGVHQGVHAFVFDNREGCIDLEEDAFYAGK